MARSLAGIVEELLRGPTDPDPVVLEDLDGDVRETFDPARSTIEQVLGPPARAMPRDAEWFLDLAPHAVAAAAWLSHQRYLLLLADAPREGAAVRLTLHALAADDVEDG